MCKKHFVKELEDDHLVRVNNRTHFALFNIFVVILRTGQIFTDFTGNENNNLDIQISSGNCRPGNENIYVQTETVANLQETSP